MKPIFTHIVPILFLTITYQVAKAQTYSVTTNKDWSALVTSKDCSGCIIQISAGVTLTFTTGGQCTNCIFQGGTLAFQSGSAGFGWYSGNTFADANVDFNTSGITMQSGTFQNDSIYFNYSTNFESNTIDFNSSHVEIATGATITAATTIEATTGTVVAMNGTSEINVDGGTGLLISASQMYLNGNSFITATSPLIIEKNSELTIGDGSATSHAYLHYNASKLKIYDNSLIKVANDNNYYYDSNAGYNYYTSTSSSTAIPISTYNNLDNCGGTYPNACSVDYVYGCATLNSGGLVTCTVLAISDIDLTAIATSTDKVELTWSDPQSLTASLYVIQRSIGNNPWQTIATTDAVAGTTGYHYNDASAPAGADDYRIVRVDQLGDSSYSTVSSVTIVSAATVGAITLYPNPASGHTFFIKTSNTEQLTVDIYTVTGQLLSRQSLQGQMQYQLLLPSQLLPGNAVIVQAISPTGKQAFPLLLQ